jgi:hypothetical protein
MTEYKYGIGEIIEMNDRNCRPNVNDGDVFNGHVVAGIAQTINHHYVCCETVNFLIDRLSLRLHSCEVRKINYSEIGEKYKEYSRNIYN